MLVKDKNLKYGRDQEADDLGNKIMDKIKDIVSSFKALYTPLTENHFMLHAQVGLDSDTGISSYSYSTETIDMTRDLKDYKNSIKSKMNFIKTLGVYPVINLKISRKLW